MFLRHSRRIDAVALAAATVVLSVILIPRGAAYSPASQLPELAEDMRPLPDFDVRAIRKPRAGRQADIKHKKQTLAIQAKARDHLALAWNDELDLPHSLISLSAPLTARSAEEPSIVARRFVRDNTALFGVSARQLEEARVAAVATDTRAGFTRLAIEQRTNGIRVFASEMLFIIDLDGRVRSESGSFIPEIDRRAPDPVPNISPEDAFRASAAACGRRLTSPLRSAGDDVPARERVVFTSDEVGPSSEASLVYYPVTREDVRLAYQVMLYGVPTPIDSYLILVDAKSGEILRREYLTCAADAPQGRVFTKENPVTSVTRELITLAGDPVASPQGWFGAKQCDGNNGRAWFNPERASNGGEYVEANADGSFDFPLDFDRSPVRSFRASATNLFYWVNMAHDRFYSLGFTEAWRNFQTDNFGKGGVGNDPIHAETLRGARLDPSAGGVRNNAFFGATLEGSPPLIAMLMWTPTVDGRELQLDSSYDASVILHEYTHGVSLRLSGTDNSIGLRSGQGSGMGEGWSDFFAMSFLDDLESALDSPRTTGSYVTQDPARGVRAYPYTTNFDLNPLAFGDIAFNPQVHAQGTVWCTMLWELRQSLIQRYGFETGRRTAEQLVVDGLKVIPLAPNFVQARDAILLADQTSNNSSNQDLIWRAFAKRGLGRSAAVAPASGFASLRVLATEGYDVPPEFSAGALVTNVKPPAPAPIGADEPLPVIVVDRDLVQSTSVDIRATNLNTGERAVLSLQQDIPGLFAGALRLLSPGQDGGPGQALAARPGDIIAISYENARNEEGTGETIEVRTVAMRRVTVYFEGFEDGAADWNFPAFGSISPNWWHITERRAVGSARSLLFAREKRNKVFSPRLSAGAAIAPPLDFRDFLRPRLDFDYFFVGATSPDGLSGADGLTVSIGNLRETTSPPPLSIAFDVRPSVEGQFRQATVELRFVEKWRSGLIFNFFTSGADVNRKQMEGFYLDNVRVTALSAH
jgi:hypothetical protein